MTWCIGIDHGNGRSKLSCLGKDGTPQDIPNQLGERSTPSAFLFTGEEVLFGKEAENACLLEPRGFVSGYKRFLGDPEWAFEAPDGTKHTAADLTQRAIQHMAADAERFTGQKLTHVALSVPANFTDAQRRAMTEVCCNLGVELLSLVNEPTAAAMAFASDKRPARPILVYDLGAGTLDVTVLSYQGDRLDVLATGGLTECGGIDLRAALEEFCLEQFQQENGFRPNPEEHAAFLQELRERCENAKLALSARKQTVVTMSLDGVSLVVHVSREDFEGLIRPILEPTIATCLEALQEARLAWSEVETICIGGASRTPLVPKMLHKASGAAPRVDGDPDHVVARGTAIEAAIRLRDRDLRPTSEGVDILPPTLSVTDVSPYPLGCLALRGNEREKRCAVIIPKNQALPARRFDVFALEVPGQREAHIVVVQGEDNARPEECHQIGDVTLELDPNGPVERRVKVEYGYDNSGIVHVVAADTHTGREATIELFTKPAQEAVS